MRRSVVGAGGQPPPKQGIPSRYLCGQKTIGSGFFVLIRRVGDDNYRCMCEWAKGGRVGKFQISTRKYALPYYVDKKNMPHRRPRELRGLFEIQEK